MSIENYSPLSKKWLLAMASSILLTSSFSANAQQILEKRHIWYWPMNDKICEFVLDTGRRAIQLCEYKSDAYRTYSKLQWGGMQHEPGWYKYTPPGQIISWPRINPRTGKFEILPPTVSSWEFGYSQWWYTYKPSEIKWCNELIKFNQKDGAPISTISNCN